MRVSGNSAPRGEEMTSRQLFNEGFLVVIHYHQTLLVTEIDGGSITGRERGRLICL
jgi:hypothetical protein